MERLPLEMLFHIMSKLNNKQVLACVSKFYRNVSFRTTKIPRTKNDYIAAARNGELLALVRRRKVKRDWVLALFDIMSDSVISEWLLWKHQDVFNKIMRRDEVRAFQLACWGGKEDIAKKLLYGFTNLSRCLRSAVRDNDQKSIDFILDNRGNQARCDVFRDVGMKFSFEKPYKVL